MVAEISQHMGTLENGTREVRLIDVRVDPTDYVSHAVYAAISPAERKEFDATLAEIHAARCELESLDVDDRAEVREALLLCSGVDMDNEAAVIRGCIRDCAVIA